MGYNYNYSYYHSSIPYKPNVGFGAQVKTLITQTLLAQILKTGAVPYLHLWVYRLGPSQRVLRTYMVECGVSTCGLAIMIWGSLPHSST